ncbi:alpha/beta hydrolase fold domain-containing protein [Ilyonectria robusta]|uniref:alpha/beta hydrolase fold domain-containing protein n=1 Tax=Ilyonectria robusta TaxID=1079257 RepID=UPI001E8CF726|nr:alpha/beta hydrolase fold domain-containing protein [Ilyonectria robusta]KAH8737077.1 alpha/beta hydrolase fold domain-containing protein [Ilyonectria robusta]
MRFSLLSTLSVGLLSAGLVAAQANGTIYEGTVGEDLNGSNFTYPYPVKLFRFESQFENLEMAFMDVWPSNKSNGRTAILFHGRNFCGATWEGTINALKNEGWRVIVPDQIGFCKSSKPVGYQFSLHQFAWNTRGLLDALDIDKVTVIGHSMGGMLSTRFSLQYPETVDDLVMVNAIGWEDYIQKGVPYISIDKTWVTESASNFASIKNYEKTTYYVGEWKDEYDTWVNMLVNIYYGSERENYVKIQAKIVNTVLTQPIAHYFGDIQARTLVMVGEKDITAIGSAWASKEVAATLGHFDVLGKEVASQIPNGHLFKFPDLGHAPQISQPERFHRALLRFLNKKPKN